MQTIKSVMSYMLQGLLPTITFYDDKGRARLVNEEYKVAIAANYLVMNMILCIFTIIIPEMKAMYHVTVANINDFLETLRWRLPDEDAVDVGLMRSLFTEVNFFRFVAICLAVLTLERSVYDLSDGHREWIFLSDGSIVSPDRQISLWERFIGPHPVLTLEEDVSLLYAALGILTGSMMLLGIFRGKARLVRQSLWISLIILLIDLCYYVLGMYYVASNVSSEAAVNFFKEYILVMLLEVVLRQATSRFVEPL